MIAGIDHEADIDIYLEKEELENLENGTILGILVKRHKPKRQGTISICVDDAKKELNGIGVDDSEYWKVKDHFHIEIYMGSEWYSSLITNGKIGTRIRLIF